MFINIPLVVALAQLKWISVMTQCAFLSVQTEE